MNVNAAKAFLAVIDFEQKRRLEKLGEADPDVAYDQWLFHDAPFINDLCLMFLTTLHHEVERTLVRLAARSKDDGRPISRSEYEERVSSLRQLPKKKTPDSVPHLARKKVMESLPQLERCARYRTTEMLRLLANAYKHDLKKEPDKELLVWLNLPTINYAEISESSALREGWLCLSVCQTKQDMWKLRLAFWIT